MLRVLGGFWEGGRFLMGEVPLYLPVRSDRGYSKWSDRGYSKCGEGGGRLDNQSLGVLYSSKGYRGTSLIRNRPIPGPYSRPMPRALWWSRGVGGFL